LPSCHHSLKQLLLLRGWQVDTLLKELEDVHPNSHKKLIEMADLSEWCDAYRTVNNYGVDKSNWSEVSLYAVDHNHPHLAHHLY
jgi:hypothetical protein